MACMLTAGKQLLQVIADRQAALIRRVWHALVAANNDGAFSFALDADPPAASGRGAPTARGLGDRHCGASWSSVCPAAEAVKRIGKGAKGASKAAELKKCVFRAGSARAEPDVTKISKDLDGRSCRALIYRRSWRLAAAGSGQERQSEESAQQRMR